jgi:hypothetical protein
VRRHSFYLFILLFFVFLFESEIRFVFQGCFLVIVSRLKCRWPHRRANGALQLCVLRGKAGGVDVECGLDSGQDDKQTNPRETNNGVCLLSLLCLLCLRCLLCLLCLYQPTPAPAWATCRRAWASVGWFYVKRVLDNQRNCGPGNGVPAAFWLFPTGRKCLHSLSVCGLMSLPQREVAG